MHVSRLASPLFNVLTASSLLYGRVTFEARRYFAVMSLTQPSLCHNRLRLIPGCCRSLGHPSALLDSRPPSQPVLADRPPNDYP